MVRFRPGETAVLRETWHGQIFEARPVVVVQDDVTQSAFFLPASVRCRVAVDENGEELRLPDRPWRLKEVERGPRPILSFAWPDTPYAVLLIWEASGELRTWYVNVQSSLSRTATGFDYTDHALDVLIAADRSGWAWKDEDELDDAVERGLFTVEEAAAFRAAGERGTERIISREPPFDERWEEWRPDPSWPAPELPPRWDVVEPA